MEHHIDHTIAISPRPPRPTALPVLFDNIPEELRQHQRWLVWEYWWDPEKERWAKPPYSPHTKRRVDTQDQAHWSTFDEARSAYERGGWDGIGIVLGDGLAGADLDDCIVNGAINADAVQNVNDLDTYTERSPSGEGIKALALCSEAFESKKAPHLEMYCGPDRYFTITGHHLPDTPRQVQERTQQVITLHRTHFPPKTSNPTPRPPQVTTVLPSEDAILARARNATNGHKFEKLWNGDRSDHKNDHSAADLALCNMLAFWTDNDHAAIDSLFRKSGLFRAKWDEVHRRDGATYGQMTIERAIRDTTPLIHQAVHPTTVDAASTLPPEAEIIERLAAVEARMAEVAEENARLRARQERVKTILRHQSLDGNLSRLVANLLLDAEEDEEEPGTLRVIHASNPKLAERYGMSESTVQRGIQRLKIARAVEAREHKVYNGRDGRPLEHPYTTDVTLRLAEALELPEEIPVTERDEKNRARSREIASAGKLAREALNTICPECGQKGCLTLVCRACGSIIEPEPETAPPVNLTRPLNEEGGQQANEEYPSQFDTPCDEPLEEPGISEDPPVNLTTLIRYQRQIDTPSKEHDISTLSTEGGHRDPIAPSPPPVEIVDTKPSVDAVELERRALRLVLHWQFDEAREVAVVLSPERREEVERAIREKAARSSPRIALPACVSAGAAV
jgi:putative DNA primase/helicase